MELGGPDKKKRCPERGSSRDFQLAGGYAGIAIGGGGVPRKWIYRLAPIKWSALIYCGERSTLHFLIV